MDASTINTKIQAYTQYQKKVYLLLFLCRPVCEFQVKALHAHRETADSLTLQVADSQMPPYRHHKLFLYT